jgi:hypothetical protein
MPVAKDPLPIVGDKRVAAQSVQLVACGTSGCNNDLKKFSTVVEANGGSGLDSRR